MPRSPPRWRSRDRSLDKKATTLVFVRAGRVDDAFRTQLAEVHRRLVEWWPSKVPPRKLAPVAPLFRDLEREAERVLNR